MFGLGGSGGGGGDKTVLNNEGDLKNSAQQL
jgi:hypothetical protein